VHGVDATIWVAMNKTVARAFAGILGVGVVLGLLLFVSAWTLKYPQAWAYLFAFLGGTTLVTVYLARNVLGLLESRNNAGPTAETDKQQQLIQSIASLFYLAMFVVAGFDFRLRWSAIPMWLSLAGDLLVLLGLWIVYRVFKVNSHTAGTIKVDEGQPVIEEGPYSVVRHPMYSGAILLVLATPVALGSWWALLCAAPMCLAIAARGFEEEKLLVSELAGYEAYREKVRYRIIPYVW
jgi:protein-S-isoprenylcysteine O-methyltransferase Ste14